MRILFVGQAPSKETDGKPPFTGKCGAFLASLMGLTQEEMLARHDFINILDYWPGKGIGGDLFPIREAQQAAKLKLPQLRDRLVVLLGANVARAFECKNFQYLRPYEMREPSNWHVIISSFVTIIPHPSGVNRYWNSESNRKTVKEFLTTLASK